MNKQACICQCIMFIPPVFCLRFLWCCGSYMSSRTAATWPSLRYTTSSAERLTKLGPQNTIDPLRQDSRDRLGQPAKVCGHSCFIVLYWSIKQMLFWQLVYVGEPMLPVLIHHKHLTTFTFKSDNLFHLVAILLPSALQKPALWGSETSTLHDWSHTKIP